ncbi:MAG: HlyC/CorC family transporter [Deltaproteobacteria bacterium]|nr:HlyC/CorC family transporter [Deltaproteobacteria bacterium]
MESDLFIKLGILIVLLVLSGFFSGSEASLFYLTHLHIHKMKEDHAPFARSVHNLLRRPRRLLITILIGNEGVNITISVIVASIFLSALGIIGKVPAIVTTTLTLLIFGEAIPKTFAVTYPIGFASAVSIPLTGLTRLLHPVVWTIEQAANLIIRIVGGSGGSQERVMTEDEFIYLVDAGHREGALEATQRDLIHRAFELADTAVSEIMTPRVDMFTLPLSLAPENLYREVLKARCTRIPVYGADRDDIVGVLNTKDLLPHLSRGTTVVDLKGLLETPHFVPMEKPVDDMLRKFQSKKTQMAIVVDEYGGVAGLVTLHDILECLVGDLRDEYDTREELYRLVDESTIILSAMMPVDKFNEIIGKQLIPDTFDTVGGFVFNLFGKLPVASDCISYGGYTFTVEKTSNTRILKIRATSGEEARHD